MNFIDQDGLMHLEPLPSDRVENSILYSVTNWLLDPGGRIGMWNLLMNCERLGILLDYPWDLNKPQEATSHDNMTAQITMRVILGTNINHLKIFHRYYHPRDFIYMGYLQGKWWSYPLLPILFIVFLHMALTKYKVRNGVKIFKTDTEILYWIRLQLPSRYRFIHWTSGIIVYFLKRKFGSAWIKTMMETYYQNPNHPNRNY